jgi:hypothetical protein
MNKRSPHLVPYNKVDIAIKKANRLVLVYDALPANYHVLHPSHMRFVISERQCHAESV